MDHLEWLSRCLKTFFVHLKTPFRPLETHPKWKLNPRHFFTSIYIIAFNTNLLQLTKKENRKQENCCSWGNVEMLQSKKSSTIKNNLASLKALESQLEMKSYGYSNCFQELYSIKLLPRPSDCARNGHSTCYASQNKTKKHNQNIELDLKAQRYHCKTRINCPHFNV